MKRGGVPGNGSRDGSPGDRSRSHAPRRGASGGAAGDGGLAIGSRRRVRSRANRRKRNVLPLLFFTLCFGLLAEVVFVALTSKRFQIASVKVIGRKNLSERDVMRVAAVPMGRNLFLFQADESAKRVAGIPRVKRVAIHRELPNRIAIHVEERQPVAILASGTTYTLIDETGIPYAPMTRRSGFLPVLRLTSGRPFTMGQPFKNPAFTTGLRSLFTIHRILGSNESLWVDPHLNLCLNRGDYSVRLGQPKDLTAKLTLLTKLLKADPRLEREALYIDLSALKDPAYMPRDSVFASFDSSRG